jgi:hypothetical protein
LITFEQAYDRVKEPLMSAKQLRERESLRVCLAPPMRASAQQLGWSRAKSGAQRRPRRSDQRVAIRAVGGGAYAN